MTEIDPSYGRWRLAVLCASVAGVLGLALRPHPPALPVLTRTWPSLVWPLAFSCSPRGCAGPPRGGRRCLPLCPVLA